MNNLSQHLQSLFLDLESKLPSFDDIDDSALAEDELLEERLSLEAAYPTFLQNLEDVEDDTDLSNKTPRKTIIVYQNQSSTADACVGDSEPESETEESVDISVPSFVPVIHDDQRPGSSVSKSLRESRDLVDKYFSPGGVNLSSGGLPMEDFDKILDSLEESLEFTLPNLSRSDSFNDSQLPKSGALPETNTAVILEKLIVHASKYDEGLKVKDFDLKNGSLKANKRHKASSKREKGTSVAVAECWADIGVPTDNYSQSCSRGVSANFPNNDRMFVPTDHSLPEEEPATVVLDLRHDEHTLEEKKKHIRRIQAILGISNDTVSDDDSD